jgi:hypothetical protein
MMGGERETPIRYYNIGYDGMSSTGMGKKVVDFGPEVAKLKAGGIGKITVCTPSPNEKFRLLHKEILKRQL